MRLMYELMATILSTRFLTRYLFCLHPDQRQQRLLSCARIILASSASSSPSLGAAFGGLPWRFPYGAPASNFLALGQSAAKASAHLDEGKEPSLVLVTISRLSLSRLSHFPASTFLLTHPFLRKDNSHQLGGPQPLFNISRCPATHLRSSKLIGPKQAYPVGPVRPNRGVFVRWNQDVTAEIGLKQDSWQLLRLCLH